MEISEKILQLIEKEKITKKKVYDYIGVSRRGFDNKIEKGNFLPIEIEKLSSLLGVPETYFFEKKPTVIFESNVSFVDEGKTKKIKIPVLPVWAFASFIESVEKGVTNTEIEVSYEYVEKIAGIKYDKFTTVAYIAGNSMYPHYKAGCKVLCTYITDGNWEYTRGACVVSLKNGMVLFKRVKSGEGRNILYLSSDNEEGGEMEIQISDILAMWKAEYKTYEPAE